MTSLFRSFLMTVAFLAWTLPASAQMSDAYNFLKAVDEGNYQEARSLMLKGIAPNIRNADGVPALVIAAGNGDMIMLEFLLQSGANANSASRADGQTALMVLAAQGNTRGVRLMLDSGAEVDKPDRGGETALIKAVKADRLRVVQHLLEAGANSDWADYSGRTALDYAEIQRSRRIEREIRQAG